MKEIDVHAYNVSMRENNSGGYWWLNESDREGLEKAGWRVTHPVSRWGGGTGISKVFHADTEHGAIVQAKMDFNNATSQYADSLGCTCCGQPFWFNVDESPYWEPEVLALEMQED